MTAWGWGVELSVGDADEARLTPIAWSRTEGGTLAACPEDWSALARARGPPHHKGEQCVSGPRPTVRSRCATIVPGPAKNRGSPPTPKHGALPDRIVAAVDDISQHPVVHTWSNIDEAG